MGFDEPRAIGCTAKPKISILLQVHHGSQIVVVVVALVESSKQIT